MRKKIVIGIIVTLAITVLSAVAFSHPAWNRVQNWDKEKVVTIEGKITDADRPIITMESEGKEYTVHVGPYRYWQDKELTLEKDNAVKITGIITENDGKMDIYPQTMVVGEKEIKLADEDGVPVWAGQGRQGRRGAGMGYGMMGRGQHGRHGGRGGRGYGNRGAYCWQ